MIAGQSPRMKWKINSGGEVRTIEEAIAIARFHGVEIPEDVSFGIDEFGELGEDFTACGPRLLKHAGSVVRWSEMVNFITGKVPFRIWKGILDKDEAIVAVLGHEMFELKRLRRLLMRGDVKIEKFVGMTCPDNPGNLHDQAWEFADSLVKRMRKGRKKS